MTAHQINLSIFPMAEALRDLRLYASRIEFAVRTMIKTTLGQNARRRRRCPEAAQSHTAAFGEHLRNDSSRSPGRLRLAAAPTRATIPSFAARVSTI